VVRAGESDGVSSVEDCLLAHAVMGGGLPQEAEWHLWEAGKNYPRSELAESHLREAEALAPDHAAVLIGLYRFYFYKGRLEEALAVANICLKKAARECNFSTNWRAVAKGDACFADLEALWPRFFMFTLKGYAYLNMRLGAVDEGRAAVEKLLVLDPTDRIGAKLLLEILRAREEGDDEP